MLNFLRRTAKPPNRKRPRIRLEQLEKRILLAGDLRTIDGSDNNETNPEWGAAGIQFLRLAPAAYADDISAPSGENRLGAREVSNIVSDQSDGPIRADRFHTDWVWQWGQFIAHDIALTTTAEPVEPFFIPVPQGDERFDPEGTGTVIIPSFRSAYDPATGTDTSNPREQTNATSAYIDASMVYGADAVRAAELRTFVGGRLKTSAGDLMPFNTAGLPNDDLGMPAEEFFLAGDPRANENIGLIATQTLFVREHNRLADEIAAANPVPGDGNLSGAVDVADYTIWADNFGMINADFTDGDYNRDGVVDIADYTEWADHFGEVLNDEEIYQEARRIVAAEVQVITYNEFLPSLMGVNPLDLYQGYDPAVNASIGNEFTTSAFRVGHSMVNGGYLRRDENNQQTPDGDTNLARATFNPQIVVNEGGLDPILRGLGTQKGQEIDVKVRHQLRHFLFATQQQQFTGLDLAALNIQRGRDHGLPDYNSMRVAYGLDPVTSFAEITSDLEIQGRLAAAYPDVNDIDAWIGGLAEDHLPGSSVGELIDAVVYDQFTRLRDGDRFWYELEFEGAQLEEIENTTLADIILRNSGIQPNEPVALQDNVFFQRRRQPADLDAGPDQTIELDVSAVLDGTLIDPGNSGPEFTFTGWSVVAGPGGVTFDDAGEIDTTATFDTVGTYVLRAGATDGVLDVTDDIEITVDPATPATPLVYTVDAADGPADLTILLNGTGLIEILNNNDPAASTSAPLADTSSIELNSLASTDDLFTIDLSAGNPIPAGGLIVRGDAGTDHISFLAGNSDDTILLGTSTFEFGGQVAPLLLDSLERIDVSAGAGDDLVQIVDDLAVEVLFVGGSGDDILIGSILDDVLRGGSGNDILLGRAGDDQVIGQGGRDLLFAGLGSDRPTGGDDDDLLVSGASDFDDDLNALALIRAEWVSPRTYAERVANLSGTGVGPRDNGDNFLISGLTVFGDGAFDRMVGDAALDWFFHTLVEDLLVDIEPGEDDVQL